MFKLTFSGHESFTCRQLWLKKGYDFLSQQRRFSDASAVVHLGVGKNMVSSIHYWMKSFGLIDGNGELPKIAEYLLADGGRDPYLERPGTALNGESEPNCRHRLRFFEYRLSEKPVVTSSDGAVDGAIDLVFGEMLDLDALLDFSRAQAPLTLYGWYRYTGQIRETLYEIEKSNHVSNVNSDDWVAVRELRRLKSPQVDRLNQQVLQGMYATVQPVM